MIRTLLLASLLCTAAAGSADAAVPLTPATDVHLLVPAFVNGEGPFPFILDTGADESAVYQWFAEQQKLKPGKAHDVGGMTGTISTPSYLLDSLAVDGREIHNVEADSFPDRHDAEIQAGVAGNDLMDGSVAIFDFPCRQVEILPKPVNMKRVLRSHPPTVEAGSVADGTQLTLPVQVGEAQGIAVLDTGSRDTRINPQFARAAGIDPSSPSFRDAGDIFGANSKAMPSHKGPIGTVRFAGVEVRNATARVIDLPVFTSFGIGDRPAMILGLDLMQGHRLVYDHDTKRFWFDTSRCVR